MVKPGSEKKLQGLSQEAAKTLQKVFNEVLEKPFSDLEDELKSSVDRNLAQPLADIEDKIKELNDLEKILLSKYQEQSEYSREMKVQLLARNRKTERSLASRLNTEKRDVTKQILREGVKWRRIAQLLTIAFGVLSIFEIGLLVWLAFR